MNPTPAIPSISTFYHGQVKRCVIFFVLGAALSLLGMFVVFALIFASSANGAVVYTSYGSGMTLPYTVSTNPGVYKYQLSPESNGPEFSFVFGAGNLVINRDGLDNKNGKVVGYHPSIDDWNGTAACLLVGDEIEWKNYSGTNYLRTDMPMPAYEWWDYGSLPWEYGWYDESDGILRSNWKPGVTGYLGLLTDPVGDGARAGYHTGWLKMRWNADSSITLLESAYETEIGKSIVVPEPAIFLLALGGSTVVLFRRNMPRRAP